MTHSQKHMRSPIIGEYWRLLSSMTDFLPPFSIESTSTLLRKHPRLPDGIFEFPYSSWPADKNNCQSFETKEHLRQFSLWFLENYWDEVQHSFALTIAILEEGPPLFCRSVEFRADEISLLTSAIGLRSKTPFAGRTLEGAIRDFWYSSGYVDYFDDLNRIFFAVLGLRRPYYENVPFPFEFRPSILAATQTTKAVQWAMSRLAPTGSSGKLFAFLENFIEIMRFSTAALNKVYDYEMLRALARKSFATESIPINPSEFLVFRKYLKLFKTELSLLRELDAPFYPRDLIEQKKLICANPFGVGVDRIVSESAIMDVVLANYSLDFWQDLCGLK